MLNRLEQRPSLFLVIIGLYFTVNLIVRISLPNSLELDEAQQILVSQWIALGYDTQPPLYNWIQTGLLSVLGPSVFALSLLKNIFLFSTYALYYLAARQVTKHAGFALVAAFGLLTLPEIVWESQRDLTHSVAMNFAVALFFYALFRVLLTGRAVFYALTGIAIGIGLISKYNFSVLVVASFIAVLATPAYRARLFTPRLMVTAVIALVIILPHGLWLVANLDSATAGSIDKMSAARDQSRVYQILTGAGSLLVAVLSFAGPSLVLYAAAFRPHFVKRLRARTPMTDVIGRMLIVATLIFLAMIVFGGASSFKGRWLSPVLLILPLYVCVKMELSGFDPRLALRRFLPVAVFVMVAIPVALHGRVTLASWFGSYEKINVPYSTFAESLKQSMPRAPGLILSESPHMAGNMRFQFPDIAVVGPTYAAFHPDPRSIKDGPALLVWRISDPQSAGIPDRLADLMHDMLGKEPSTIVPQSLRIPYHYAGTTGDFYEFGYAWVEPN